MEISCNTSRGIAMVLASSTATTPKSSRSWARYTTGATAARCFVASSALTPPDSHSDFLPSPQWHKVAWRYFDSSPFPTHATMKAGVFDLAVLQDHLHTIPESSSSPINSVSNSYPFNNCFFSHIRSSRKPVHSKSSRARREECLEFHVETLLDVSQTS